MPKAGPPDPLGARLKALRVVRGLSLRALAELSGLQAYSLSRIERGLVDPQVSTVRRLAFALGVESGELLGT